MTRRYLLFLFSLLAAPVVASSQTIHAWDFVAAPPVGRDSCQVVANAEQFKAALVRTGWAASNPLPAVNWSNRILLVTSADLLSKPGKVQSSEDGRKLWIQFASVTERNSGVFIVALTDMPAAMTSCAVFIEPEVSDVSGQHRISITHSATSTMHTSTRTTTMPQ